MFPRSKKALHPVDFPILVNYSFISDCAIKEPFYLKVNVFYLLNLNESPN